MNRMKKDMNNVKVTYDWVIIQAGGNDLACNNTPEAIFERMKALWDIPLKSGAKVMYVSSSLQFCTDFESEATYRAGLLPCTCLTIRHLVSGEEY